MSSKSININSAARAMFLIQYTDYITLLYDGVKQVKI